MERFTGLFDEFMRRFEAIEKTLTELFARIPGLGDFASGNSGLIIFAMIMLIAIFVIKPLVKWSFGIIALGAAMAGAVAYFTGMAFWGVLPLTALVASLVMFSNKFTMG